MKYLLGLVLFLSGFLIQGQTKTLVGLKAGGGLSTAYMRHSVLPVVMNIKWLPGLTGGIQVTHFPEKFNTNINAGIQLGVNFAQKGWVQAFKDTSDPNHRTQIDYLEIPIEAVGYFGNQNKYFVSAGFFVEYALSAHVDPVPVGAVVDPSGSGLMKVGQSDFYRYKLDGDNRLSYGPRGSIGVFRETNVGVFRLEGFFTFSIRSVFDFEPLESNIPDLSLNYGAGATLSYMIAFGKLDL